MNSNRIKRKKSKKTASLKSGNEDKILAFAIVFFVIVLLFILYDLITNWFDLNQFMKPNSLYQYE